jgi:hypothetical protein
MKVGDVRIGADQRRGEERRGERFRLVLQANAGAERLREIG